MYNWIYILHEKFLENITILLKTVNYQVFFWNYVLEKIRPNAFGKINKKLFVVKNSSKIEGKFFKENYSYCEHLYQFFQFFCLKEPKIQQETLAVPKIKTVLWNIL